MAETTSWWVGLDREAFMAAWRREADRLRVQGARWTILNGATGVERVPRRFGRRAAEDEARWDEVPGGE